SRFGKEADNYRFEFGFEELYDDWAKEEAMKMRAKMKSQWPVKGSLVDVDDDLDICRYPELIQVHLNFKKRRSKANSSSSTTAYFEQTGIPPSSSFLSSPMAVPAPTAIFPFHLVTNGTPSPITSTMTRLIGPGPPHLPHSTGTADPAG